jgi:hypothetical protein
MQHASFRGIAVTAQCKSSAAARVPAGERASWLQPAYLLVSLTQLAQLLRPHAQHIALYEKTLLQTRNIVASGVLARARASRIVSRSAAVRVS